MTDGVRARRTSRRLLTRRWLMAVPVLLGAVLTNARPTTAVESGPQGIVRQFCQADALGRRANLSGWADFMPIVSWSFEPAWDFAVLITGYTIDPPRPAERGALDVNVNYSVVGQVSALGLETSVHVETVTFRVHAPEVGWRIIGPPPPPHLFGSRVDIEVMHRYFEYGTVNFLPNSLFVWQMLRSAGWNVPFARTGDLLAGGAYRPVKAAQVGDVVVYLRDDVPYHVGFLEAENQVVSSTLNAGIVRTAVDAFAGDVRYLRLVEPEGMRAGPTTRAAPPKPANRLKAPQSVVRQPQPSPRSGVEPTVGPPPRRTPVAGGASP